jgi:DNA-binding SARP family transcriptional activator/tetratricopeptide (TPR) repeat protein
MLDIRLLGSPQVTIDGEEIEVDTRKAIAMLAYLAIEGSADRDSLAVLFWADSPKDRARATLRRTLSALRSGIGSDAIAADRNQVELSGDFRVDVDQFAACIDETAGHEHDDTDVCPQCLAPLKRAAELYRDDFLGAFSVRDAPEFEDWARPVTESLRLKAGAVHERLAMALATTGDYTGAIESTGRWIDLDELHEPAHRLLMLLNAWAGDRPGAIQAYRDCVAILDRELGVTPLEETTELYEAILDEDLPPAPGVRRAVRAARTTPKAMPHEMIGRESETGVLIAALEQARVSARICLLTGDSWMGKTRLIEHLSEHANRSGFFVITARAYRAETKLPYGVATQMMQRLVERTETEGKHVPDWVLEELSRLDPKLAPGREPPNTGRMGALRLREAFVSLVEAVAEIQPILMSFDDAQWIDVTSAEMIAYLCRRISASPALVVISSRNHESLHMSLREITTGAQATVELGPLGVPALQNDYPEADLDGIISATGGIPLLVKEALDSGSVSPDSRTVGRYMESRRSRLSDLGRQVMAAAAVLDGMCDAHLLRDTSGRTEDEIVEAVEELILADLLREGDDGRLDFTLDVLETVTYESTSLIRRRLLHRRAAVALEGRSRSRTDARLASATASHHRAAGSDDAADWFRLAGDLAREVFANDEAVTAYENAIALGHPDVGYLRLSLGELAMARGDYQTATSELRAAASHSDGETLALVEHRIGDLNRILGRFELAEESFDRAVAEHPEPGALYADWALLKHRTGDAGAAVAYAERATDAARESDDAVELARALNILGVVTSDSETAMQHIDRALEMVGPADPARMAALNNKARLLASAGDVAEAMSLVDEATTIAEKAGYRHHRAALLNHLADLHHQAGNEEQAQLSLTEAVKLFADIDAGDWEPEVWLLREW